jgi:hypothetical protein
MELHLNHKEGVSKMAESKYAKYIVYQGKPNFRVPPPGSKPVDPNARPMNTHMMFMDSDVVEGAFYSECAWFWPGSGNPKGGGGGSHTHPFEEVVAFIGSNPDDPSDLGGEVEFWIGDEQFVLTKSFMAFVPAEVKHCPLFIRRVDKPIFHFTLGPGKKYGPGI